MSYRNISCLDLPLRRYRPDISDSRKDGRAIFESEDATKLEDARRSVLLRSAAHNSESNRTRIAAAALAKKLSGAISGGYVATTLASSQYMRDQRIRICGALWELADDISFGQPSTFTAIGRGLKIPGPKLADVNPQRLCAAFRSDLNRHGAKSADGYLIAFIDGEYEPETDIFRLHFHGLVAGGMIGVLNGLREKPKYRTKRRKHDSWETRSLQRIKISRGPLTAMPDPITYLLKSFWSSRWEGPIDGTMRRQNRKCRIKEPRHSELLLWLDRWSLQEITLIMGLRVGASGLKVTRPKTYMSGDTK